MKTMTIALALVLSTTANAQWKKVKGNGNVTTAERSVGEYDAVTLSGWFDVHLVKGDEGQLTIKGEENLLEYIITEVRNDKLVIKTKNGINLKPSSWNEGILVTVPVEHISAVSLSGSGDIMGKTTLQSDDFYTSISGSGDIELAVEATHLKTSMSGSGDIALSGNADSFDISVSGSGDIKAYDVEANNVDVQISGSADVKVTANESLKAKVSGSGDINYRGNPKKINTKASGSGNISKG